MNGKTILITGAAGFTGRYFIAKAKQAGYRCVALCQKDNETVPEADDRATGNLLDLSSLQHAVANARPHHVLHLAAISFVAHGDIAEIYQTNLVGTLNLLTAVSQQAPDVERIIVASSANIYGNTAELPITEYTPAAPVNHYGVSKHAMEQAMALFGDLPLVTVRPFNYTGVGQNPGFLIPKIVNAFRANKKSIELGNLDVARDFSDVRDIATAYLKLLESKSPHAVYNICSGQHTALVTIIDALNQLAGYNIDVKTNPAFARSDEIKTLYGSPSLLEGTIGKYRKFTLLDTLAWMLGNEVD